MVLSTIYAHSEFNSSLVVASDPKYMYMQVGICPAWQIPHPTGHKAKIYSQQ